MAPSLIGNTAGQAYCWGEDSLGQLGTGNKPQTVVAGQVPTGVTFAQISAGAAAFHTCALGSDNNAYCWGLNNRGQLGNGNTGGSADTPQAVLAGQVPPGVTFSQISVGNIHTCALGSNSQAYCWGRNVEGQLGNGNNTNTPQAVVMP